MNTIFSKSLMLTGFSLLLGAGLVACDSSNDSTSTAIPVAAAPENDGFTNQAESGAAIYASNCASCHGANLEGSRLGPLLSGRSFLQRWGEQTPALLLGNIKANMPPGGGNNISDQDYLHITAHILAVNGVDGVDAPLTASTDFTIAENVSELVAMRERPEPAAPTGLTVAGNTEDFVEFEPLTAERLANPDPADWPAMRRNPHAHSFSPLDQVNTDNVGNLTLEWVWNMHEGDSEPSPLVYNGIVYLINPGNVI